MGSGTRPVQTQLLNKNKVSVLYCEGGGREEMMIISFDPKIIYSKSIGRTVRLYASAK